MRILNTIYEPVPPSDPMTSEEILDLCCESVPFDPCAKVGKVSVYQGAEQEDWDFDPDEELRKAQENEAWKNSGRRIVSVSTEGVGNRSGKPCGQKYETWEGHNNCCDFVEPMAWDTETSVEVLAPNSRGIVGVTGGAPPYHWSVRGMGFALNQQGNLRDGFTDTPYTYIYALHNACGFAPIEVTDGCSVVNDGVRATIGQWQTVAVPPCTVRGTGTIAWNSTMTSVDGQYRVSQRCGSNWQACDYYTPYAPCTESAIAAGASWACALPVLSEPPCFDVPSDAVSCGADNNRMWRYVPPKPYPQDHYGVEAWIFSDYSVQRWVC